MQVVKETLSPCQVSLQISVEPDRVAQAVDKAYREFSKHIAVPGFRRGRAPLAFVKMRVPEEQLRERTANLLVEPAYKEAIEQEHVEPYAAAKLEVVSLETQPPDQKFEFKALVPLPPKVELGEYRALAVDRDHYVINDEAVAIRLEETRQRAAEYPVITDRPAQIGDTILTELTTTPDGASEPGEPQETVISLGDPDNIPGLDQQIIGLSVGDEKSFRLKYPEASSNEELAGKEAGFFAKILKIHEKKLPLLDDDFAKKFGSVDTLDEMKSMIRAGLEKQVVNAADSLVASRLVEQIVSASKIEFPDVLVDTEIEANLQELLYQLERRKVDLDDYLTGIGKTKETYLQELREKAEGRIRRALVLAEISAKERISVEKEDIDAEVAERAAKIRTTPEAVRAYIDAYNQSEMLARETLTKKVLAFLKASAIITERVVGSDPAQIDSAAEPAA